MLLILAPAVTVNIWCGQTGFLVAALLIWGGTMTTAGDVVATAALAVSGAMAPVALGPVVLALGIAAAWMLALDPVKVWILRGTHCHW